MKNVFHHVRTTSTPPYPSKNLRAILAILVLILTLPLTIFLLQQQQTIEQRAATRTPSSINRAVPGELIVKYKNSLVLKDASERVTKRSNTRRIHRLERLSSDVISVPQGQENEFIREIQQDPDVAYVEPNYLYEALFIPNDTNFASRQYGLENTGQTGGTADADIDASLAWDKTQGSSDIKIAVLDSGIDQDHPDLAGKVVANQNFTDSITVDDKFGHGTHVAGIIAAVTNNGIGVAGTCPQCRLMNGKVLGDNGVGTAVTVANGITWASDNGARVMNLSLGAPQQSQTLEDAINYAWGKGVVVVIAGGNCGGSSATTNSGCNYTVNPVIYPAAYENAIAVTATDNNDQKASFSESGASWVDLAAPGKDIFSTTPNHAFALEQLGYTKNYAALSGTSMASPFVAGVAGLVWTTSYGTSATSVRARIESTADSIGGTGSLWSKGRVNAAKAVGVGAGGTGTNPSPTPSPTTVPGNPTVTPTTTPTNASCPSNVFTARLEPVEGLPPGSTNAAGTTSITITGQATNGYGFSYDTQFDPLPLSTITSIRLLGTSPPLDLFSSPITNPEKGNSFMSPSTYEAFKGGTVRLVRVYTQKNSDGELEGTLTCSSGSTPSATSTVPTPTPTQSGPTSTQNASKFSFTIALHGVGSSGDTLNPTSVYNSNPLHKDRALDVEVYDGAGDLVLKKTGTVSKSGQFSGTIDIGIDLGNKDYLIKVKSPKYLKKRVPGVVTPQTGATYTMPSLTLVAGDIDNDNRLTVLDYSLLIGCYSLDKPAKSCDNAKRDAADLTDDGKVNQFDYNLFIREYAVQTGD